MSINYVVKDITTVTEGVVAHGCNCQGVMGGGVALAIRNKWPVAYSMYADMCREFKAEHGTTAGLLGTVNLVTIQVMPVLIVANLFTQYFFGTDRPHANINAIREALAVVIEFCEASENRLYLPQIGSGLGGLSWEDDVRPVLEELAAESPSVEITVCLFA